MSLSGFFTGRKDREVLRGETMDEKPLYNFSDEKSKYLGQYRFILLGSMGFRDKKTYKEVQLAVKEMGFDDEVLFIRNNREILKFGVVETPALVMDGKVVTYGKDFKREEVKELIKEYVRKE